MKANNTLSQSKGGVNMPFLPNGASPNNNKSRQIQGAGTMISTMHGTIQSDAGSNFNLPKGFIAQTAQKPLHLPPMNTLMATTGGDKLSYMLQGGQASD